MLHLPRLLGVTWHSSPTMDSFLHQSAGSDARSIFPFLFYPSSSISVTSAWIRDLPVLQMHSGKKLNELFGLENKQLVGNVYFFPNKDFRCLSEAYRSTGRKDGRQRGVICEQSDIRPCYHKRVQCCCLQGHHLCQ